MTSLRVIILVVGVVLIVVIYFWETIKHRRQQRKQTISPSFSEQEYSGIRITSDHETDSDYADVLSELNQALAETKRKAEFAPPNTIVSRADGTERSRHMGAQIKSETRDMFGPARQDAPVSTGLQDSEYQNVNENQIIALHITALPTGIFNGNDILDAVNNVGLEFGEMNIFHHYGIGDMQGQRPLFSLADMFEPGSFDLARLDQHHTRGLTLFFFLPIRVDSQVVFELMLNTAQRLAKRLGGEIRGPDHNMIDDEQIAAIRSKINYYNQI
ncbi:MAG: Cell division protein ZipA [Gammaproteobacteria bacterium]|nr:Cell division protein ZipA [Gammaproteobacteria bacterium]